MRNKPTSSLILPPHLAKEYAAGKMRSIADAKEQELRRGVEAFVSLGYRVEELSLIEQRHPTRDPNLDRVMVAATKARHPLVLRARLWWRQYVRVYVYKTTVDRDASKVMRP